MIYEFKKYEIYRINCIRKGTYFRHFDFGYVFEVVMGLFNMNFIYIG